MDRMISEALDGVIKALKDDPIYHEYKKRLDEIKQDPGLKERIDQLRQRNFDLQQNAEADELFDQLDALENEIDFFRDDTRVEAFLNAEVAFCRLMQEIQTKLVVAVGFE